MKHSEWKERLSLTFVYAAVIFCIQLLSVTIGGILLYILARSGLLDEFSEGYGAILIFMVVVSTLASLVITFLTRRIPLKPFNRIIDQINRLAAGDYSARLEFGKPLNEVPAFEELSGSFNTMAQELQNTELLRSDFINNFSHEFKTPIVSIAGFAKLLRRGNLNQAQREEYIAIIEEESLRLAAMATNALELSRVENQNILTDISSFNLSEQLRSSVLLLENQWSRKELALDLEFEEYTIQANEELLKQVWINLLDNAIKFSPTTGEIRIRIRDFGTELQVSVTNYGSDIPFEKQTRIWDKFYQADESHASKGNGVGLAIVKRIIQLHKGKATVTSANGTTTFTVMLPKKL